MITRVKGFLKRHKSLLHQWNLAQTTLNICICKINNRWGQNIIKQMQITIINDNNENVSLHTTTDSELLAAETSSSEQNVKKGHSSWLVPNLVQQRSGFIDQCHYQACIQMRVTAFKCKCAKWFKCKCKCKCTAFESNANASAQHLNQMQMHLNQMQMHHYFVVRSEW